MAMLLGEILLFAGPPAGEGTIALGALTITAETSDLIGSGTFNVGVDFTSSAAFGSIGDGTLGLSFDLSGTGAHGNIADGTLQFSIDITSTAGSGMSGSGTFSVYVANTQIAANPTGGIGSGTQNVYVEIASSTGFVSANSGSGTLEVTVTLDGSGTSGADYGNSVWVVYPVNIANMSVTEHSTPFNSMCSVNGKTYAASSSGLYLVDGRTDNGTAIASAITKRAIDLGVGYRKTATDLFLRMMSEGSIVVNVESETGSGNVTVTDNIQKTHGCKVNLPRGVRGREITLSLTNSSGAYFEINSMEILFLVSQNRRGRQVA